MVGEHRRLLSGSHTVVVLCTAIWAASTTSRVTATTWINASVITRTGSGRIMTPLHVTGLELK
ncbi:MAG: hypothetical protein QXU69_04250 [Thermofilaceae archaeon]